MEHNIKPDKKSNEEDLLNQEIEHIDSQEQQEELSPENKAMKEALEEIENAQDLEKKMKEFEQTIKEIGTYIKVDKHSGEILEEGDSRGISDYALLKENISKQAKKLLQYRGRLYSGAGTLAVAILLATVPDMMEQFQETEIADSVKNTIKVFAGITGVGGISMGFKGVVEAIKNKTLRNKALKRAIGLGASGVPLDQATEITRHEMSKQSKQRGTAEKDVTDILVSEDNFIQGGYGKIGIEQEKNKMTQGSATEYEKVNTGDTSYISSSTREYELDPNLLNQIRFKLTELGVEGPNQDISDN
jgi:hypothetical protein